MNLWSLVGIAVAIVTAPLWIPLGIYIGMTYHWEDTVPKEEGEHEH
jgi:hypothetical protein